MTPPKSVDAAARAYYDAVKATGRVSIYELVDRAGVDRKTVIRHMAKGYLRGERMVIGGKDTWTFSEPETLRYCDVAPMLVEQGRHTGGSSPPETPTGYMTIEELAARRGCSHWFVRDGIRDGKVATMEGKHGKLFIAMSDAIAFRGPQRHGRTRLTTVQSVVFHIFDEIGLPDSEVAAIAAVSAATVARWRSGKRLPSLSNAGQLLAWLRARHARTISLSPDLRDLAKMHRTKYMRMYMRRRRRMDTA